MKSSAHQPCKGCSRRSLVPADLEPRRQNQQDGLQVAGPWYFYDDHACYTCGFPDLRYQVAVAFLRTPALALKQVAQLLGVGPLLSNNALTT